MSSSTPDISSQGNGTASSEWRATSSEEGFVVEGWGEGFVVGALIIMACTTVAVMRKGILLHKLILVEQFLAIPHGTFCFMAFSGYGWYVSSTATLLYCSYFLHNVVAWLKVQPFFVGKSPSFFTHRTGRLVQWVYCLSLALTVPVWIFNIYNNFLWNNDRGGLYRQVRPLEFLVRDPWWLSTNIVLFHVIRKTYGLSVLRLIRLSPRLGILLLAIFLAIAFTAVDVVASILKFGSVEGINPYWKLSLVFKCLTDAIMLDDFATELKRIGRDRRLPNGLRQFDLPLSEGDARRIKRREEEDGITSPPDCAKLDLVAYPAAVQAGKSRVRFSARWRRMFRDRGYCTNEILTKGFQFFTYFFGEAGVYECIQYLGA